MDKRKKIKQKESRKVILVVGARPNFIKIAPIAHAIDDFNNKAKRFTIERILVHTGQHYDFNMSGGFLKDLKLAEPDICLGACPGSHGEQTAKIMVEFEKVCIREKPDVVFVAGDVNSTLACSIAAAKLHIPIAHVEAGLRSFDRSMPEEINRIVTDSLCDFFFTTCKDANKNLKREGVPEEKIYFVGNVMIDALHKFRPEIEKRAKITVNAGKEGYALLTLHRPVNVEDRGALRNILEALREISKKIPVIFPAHPKTQEQIKSFGYEKYFNFSGFNAAGAISPKNAINLSDPLLYLEFLNLMTDARFILTDSGGIQEETTVLGVPCLTLRKNTERPVTVEEGTNILVGGDRATIVKESLKILNGKKKTGRIPELWDGKASERIVNILSEKL